MVAVSTKEVDVPVRIISVSVKVLGQVSVYLYNYVLGQSLLGAIDCDDATMGQQSIKAVTVSTTYVAAVLVIGGVPMAVSVAVTEVEFTRTVLKGCQWSPTIFESLPYEIDVIVVVSVGVVIDSTEEQ